MLLSIAFVILSVNGFNDDSCMVDKIVSFVCYCFEEKVDFETVCVETVFIAPKFLLLRVLPRRYHRPSLKIKISASPP